MSKTELKKFVRRLRRLSRKWQKHMLDDAEDLYARNRYEGISTGFRWAAEDLEKKLFLRAERRTKKPL